MKEIQLYPFQLDAVERVRECIRQGKKNIILSSPTGSGKTVIGTHFLEASSRKERRSTFIADRINLIDQTSAMLDTYGISHGVIQAQHWRSRPWEKVQVASAPTLERRSWDINTDLMIIDEAHGIRKVITDRISKRDCITIGLTATPFTKGLGKFYDAIVNVTTTNKLIAEGYLSKYRIFAASEPDMSGAEVVAGEWTDKAAAERAMPIIGDCVAEYLKHGDNKKFIAFGVNVAHCEEMQAQMMAAGVQCALYTYQTGDEERAEMVREFRKPDSYIRGLISVAALSKGFDVPDVEVIIMARPLRSSFAEHIQIMGRGLRRDPANPDKVCTILDHAGNVVRFWQEMHDFYEHGWDVLDDGKRKPKKKADQNPEKASVKCPRCFSVHMPARVCPSCGFIHPRRSDVTHQAGELIALAGGATAPKEQKQEIWSQLQQLKNERGYSDGWAAHKYRERFGVWPRGLHDTPKEPTPALVNWVRSRQIAYAKSQKKS